MAPLLLIFRIILVYVMKNKSNNSGILQNYVGMPVSLPDPWEAISRYCARVALGDVVELVDCYCVPVWVRETDSIVNVLKYHEKYHHILTLRDESRLYCAYLTLPRLILACRNFPVLGDLLLSSPLVVSEG